MVAWNGDGYKQYEEDTDDAIVIYSAKDFSSKEKHSWNSMPTDIVKGCYFSWSLLEEQ